MELSYIFSIIRKHKNRLKKEITDLLPWKTVPRPLRPLETFQEYLEDSEAEEREEREE